ncbi:MAG: TonB-dependent receptor [Prevotellaceae bacterium]|jgi:iron complex outermembrane receptor protein|nr:TonB-dependent receptor [Prevotellaceae bacterium]
MKKIVITMFVFCSVFARAYSQESDTMRVIELDEIQVTATRAESRTPVTHSLVTKSQIESSNYGQDIPFILTLMPSTVATSDAGAGIGATGIRIRGVDPTRINVTTNSIPMNDAESHSVFWVNMPDLVSSLADIQIQRGAGSSTNGAGAFGASINMQTESLSYEPYGQVSISGGSYNTHRETVKLGTGMLNNHFAFSARLSNINSDGYISRASSKLQSFFAQGAYYGNGAVVKFITFGGKEETYHAWDGIDAETMKINRRYNPCGEMQDENGDVVGFYKNQTDNYIQYNYQLLYNQRLSNKWNFNVTLHYTRGDGYYEEYKNNRTLVEYGLQPFIIDGETINKSNLIRQKQMYNDFYGGIFSLNYRTQKISASMGGGINKYTGDHWGNVTWVKNYIGNLDANHEYYRNSTDKADANIFIKTNYEIYKNISLYADLQYRRITHVINGENDNWDWINEKMQSLKVDNTYNFFNPKFGFHYQINKKNEAYVSLAVANKEPTRNNFTDAKFDAAPKSERLYDYELGYNFNSNRINFGATLYYMNYKNQLVLTGETNDIGEALTDNVAKSYRSGIELMLGLKLTDWLHWNANATFSRNIIKDYTEYLDDYDEHWNALYTQTANYMSSTDIAYSPAVIAGSLVSFRFGSFNAALQSIYVSKQYVTNSKQDDLKLDSYFINNVRVDYTLRTKSFGTFNLGVAVNNILNKKYCSNGWGSSSYINDNDGNVLYRSNYMGYFPQATCNFMINISVQF